MSKKYNIDKIIIVLFFIVILSPGMGKIFLKPDVSIENRVLTPMPKWTGLETLSDMEGYLTDRLVFRKQFVQLYSYLDYKLFNKSITQKVIIGKDGELFWAGEGVLEDIKRETKLPQSQIDNIVKNQIEIKKEMDKRGIKYLIVIPPSKENIYTDRLPDYYAKNDGSPSRKEQVLTALKTNTDIDILDLSYAIKDEYKQREVYISTDSHWNNDGAFRGYQEIIKHLKTDYPDLPMYQRSDFYITKKESTWGNLTEAISLKGLLPAKNIVIYNPGFPGKNEPIIPSYADPNSYSKAFYMINNKNLLGEGLPKCVMYRDSFAGLDEWVIGNVNRVICNSFSEFVSYANPQVDFNYIDIEKPDIVIVEHLETYVERLGANYILPGENPKSKPVYSDFK